MPKYHYVVFDGTSTYICSEDELTSDMEIMYTSHRLNDAERECDRLNKEIIGEIIF